MEEKNNQETVINYEDILLDGVTKQSFLEFINSFLIIWEVTVSEIENVRDTFLSFPLHLLPIEGKLKKSILKYGFTTVGSFLTYAPNVGVILKAKLFLYEILLRIKQLYETRGVFIQAESVRRITGHRTIFDFITEREKNDTPGR